MPSVGHVAVGLAAARVRSPPARVGVLAWTALLVLCSCLPDLDVIAFRLGIPYSAPFGHRGAVHSLAFAVVAGLAFAWVASANGLPAVRIGSAVAVVMAAHGLLDTLTDGGLGVALLWPLSNARVFAPWRPIPVAPIGAALLTSRGIQLMLHECVLFLPFFILGLWPRARTAT
jgi:inner membrane protein